MIYKKDFEKKSRLAVWRYEIWEGDSYIIIRFQQIPGTKKHLDYPDDEMLISQMHIANIPAIVAAIFRVFQTDDVRGGIYHCEENGDKLTVSMLSDDRGKFSELTVSDESRRLKTELPNMFEFVFEDLILTNNPPLPRTPTPAMIWVTDTLMKIHDEWKKKQKENVV